MRQNQLAERLGITSPYLSELLSGKKSNPSVDLVQRICSEFSVQRDWLFGVGDTAPTGDHLQAAILAKDYGYAFSLAVEMMSDSQLIQRTNEILSDSGRPLETRVAFGKAALEELESRSAKEQKDVAADGAATS